jgi:AcrR family transcriptional regulator
VSSKDTRRKILDTALTLFNRFGFVNVRLQHISDETIISLGNITYHYRTKDIMVAALWEEIRIEQIRLLAEFRAMPLFEDVDRYLTANYLLHEKYRFFYQDTLEVLRAYEQIAERYREHLQWLEQQTFGMLLFNKARGAIQADIEEQELMNLAAIWTWNSEAWVNRSAIKGSKEVLFDHYKDTQWLLLKPYFTEEGHREYSLLTIQKAL